MNADEVFAELKERMEASLEALGRDFGKLRTGRASPSILDDVRVEAYGQLMPLNQVATVSVPEPRTLRIAPFDPTNVGAIERAIQKSGLGLNPNNDGKQIHINIPALTEERRKDFIKLARQHAEECRVSERSARHEALGVLKQLEKDKELSQDDHKKAAERVQTIIDEYGKKVDAVLKKKEEEILEV